MSQRNTEIEGLSRVELEHRLAADLCLGTPGAIAEADAIRLELAARVWQNHNPYENLPMRAATRHPRLPATRP